MNVIKRYLFVFLFGIIGGCLRQLVLKPICHAVNLVGCFCFVMVMEYLPQRFSLNSDLVSGLSAGLVGSFTTFSTFNLDAIKLLIHGQFIFFSIYLVITILGGLGIIKLSQNFSQHLLNKRGDWSWLH